MLTKLEQAGKVVGVKQVRRALKDGRATGIYPGHHGGENYGGPG